MPFGLPADCLPLDMSRILAPLRSASTGNIFDSRPSSRSSAQFIRERSKVEEKAQQISPAAAFTEVLNAARDAVRTLRSLGVHSCAMGDLAGRLLANTRHPTDIELLVISERMDAETVKRRIAFHNPNFYTASSSDPSYRALYYRSLSTPPLRIHILVPPSPTLPYLSSADIEWLSGFPLAPFSLLLLLKLRAWSAHRFSPDARERRAQYTDHADLQALLQLAVRRGVKPANERCLSAAMLRDAQRMVKEYVALYPSSRSAWTKLDMVPPEPKPAPPTTSSIASFRRPSLPSDPPTRPSTMMETLRSKSPFMRKRSGSNKSQDVPVTASYMDWTD